MSLMISLAQYPIQFHADKKSFLLNLENWFQQAKQPGSEILVFPEYGSMDLVSLSPKESQLNLSLQLEQLQTLHSFFLDSFIDLAKKYQVYVVAPSFPLQVNEKYFNRAYFISPSGQYDFQDKIHMTRFENEDWGISSSETPLKVFDTRLGKIGIQICFDIEFPWATALLAQAGVDLVLVPSCTEGLAGMHRVHTGAKARALENQIYTAVSHTVGDALWSQAVDKNTGLAAIFSTSDRYFSDDGIVATGKLNEAIWLHSEIDVDKIKQVRTDGQVFNFKETATYPWKPTNQKNLVITTIRLK